MNKRVPVTRGLSLIVKATLSSELNPFPESTLKSFTAVSVQPMHWQPNQVTTKETVPLKFLKYVLMGRNPFATSVPEPKVCTIPSHSIQAYMLQHRARIEHSNNCGALYAIV